MIRRVLIYLLRVVMPIKVAIPCPVSELKKDLQIQNLLNEDDTSCIPRMRQLLV